MNRVVKGILRKLWHRPAAKSERTKRQRLGLESLEDRCCPAVDVLSYHGDPGSTGDNLNETQLTPANVQVGSFGKLFGTLLDGQVYAQPLIKTNLIVTGQTQPKTVVFAATENDSVYAIDSLTGAILWQRSFLDVSNANNNTLGATSIAPIPYADTASTDIMPNIGITGTPVIDPTTNTLYVVPVTKEIIGGNVYYVQRLHAISLIDGTDQATPFLVGSTTNGNTNNTPIYSYGYGSGFVIDPYNGTGQGVVQFNALRENQRGALTLSNGMLYVDWASHGDNGPYHGWLVGWNVSNLLTTGFALKGVFDTSPTGGLGGIWQGGGKLVFESDGTTFYFAVGNGGGGHANPTLNAAGFPSDGNYYEALVKMVPDSTTSPSHQNANGWGFKVADYFIPYDQVALDNADQDFGSSAPVLLPDSAGIAGHPHLMLIAGKEGKIYVVDRDNMGHYDPNNDNVLNASPDVSGHNTPPVQIGGALSTASYYNGKVYWVGGYNGPAEAFVINSSGSLTVTSQTTSPLGNLSGSTSVSANGTTNGIVWAFDRNNNELHAYGADSFTNELWNSNQKSGGADALGAAVKFAVPTVANGEVFAGTSAGLVAYGLTPPAGAAPNAPQNLAATTLSSTSINLSWTDPTAAPNLATGYAIFSSTDDVNFTQLTTAPAGAHSLALGGLTPVTTYYFMVRGFNAIGQSGPSNVVSATTNNLSPGLDFSGGFSNSANGLSYNGSAAIVNGRARITGSSNQAGSVFSAAPVDVSRFNTQFTFQLPASVNSADGITFTIQGVGPTALGPGGGGLGYGAPNSAGSGGIAKSLAIKFDLYNNEGEGANSTGLYLNGAAPTVAGSIDLTPSGINLHSGDPVLVTMTYDGVTLSVKLTDTVTGQTAAQSYPVNIGPVIGSTTAYVGFTGGTGYFATVQDILSWVFSPNASQAPAAPTALGGQPASATSVGLSWSSTATNQTGFHLDRATDAAFTQNLITQTLPSSPNSFTDTATGLAPGGTFYYRIRSFNSAGDSGNSNVVSVTIPLAPAKPTGARVTNVTTSEIDLAWTDNAGRTATGYNILRAVNHGSFVTYATLPALNDTPPYPYSWADTGVAPGNFYEYHIQAFNIAGYNDFSGTNATAITIAPTNVSAQPGDGTVTLSWIAPMGAVTYNVYRGTTSGGELTTPIATGLTGTSYMDTAVVNGSTYYYTITAVNANTTITPVVPSESAPSVEVSAKPGSALAAPAINFSNGFSGSGALLQFNGAASINGVKGELTNGSNETSSFFTLSSYDVTHFNTQFVLRFPATVNSADGLTFVLQGVAPTAIGLSGGGIGYGPSYSGGPGGIGSSVAVKFDLYSNQGEGPDSTGLYTNGAAPTNAGSIDLTPTGINLHSGHDLQVTVNYDGTTLTVNMLDLVTNAAAQQTYAVNIPQIVGGNKAYVGFTGSTGYFATTQDVMTWTFSPGSVTNAPSLPSSPTAAQVASVSTSQIALTWNDFAGASASGYHILRSVNGGAFMAYATLPALAAPGLYSWTDSAVAPGTLYQYQIAAYNSAGSSAAVQAGATTITLPPSGLTANPGAGAINLTWAAPAGAVSYKVYRGLSANGELAAPLANNVTTTAFTDSTVTAGTVYYYNVTAVNSNASLAVPLSSESARSSEAFATAPQGINFSAGFAGSTTILTYNGSSAINGTKAELTSGSNQTGSVFTTSKVSVTKFNSEFTFQLPAGASSADGFTFVIQGVGPAAIGAGGGGLGYGAPYNGGPAGIGASVAIKFDTWNNQGEGPNSTGLYINGAAPTSAGAIDLTPSGVDLHSGDTMQVNLTYDGANLTVVIADTLTGKSFSNSYAINIPQTVGGSSAYVGFTAGTGYFATRQDVLGWTFTPTP